MLKPAIALFFLLLSFGKVFGGELSATGPIPFENFDSNGDNMINPQEYVETHNQRKKLREQAGMPNKRKATPSFTDFDQDGNNLISRQELESGRQAMGRGGQGMASGKGMGRGHQMPKFSEFDLNGDGVLLKEEFYDARAKHWYERAEQGYKLRNAAKAPPFETVDSNGDGKVNKDEFEEHQAQHRKTMRGQ
jgi:Ca2+-binding EF-hand superfamily protein